MHGSCIIMQAFHFWIESKKGQANFNLGRGKMKITPSPTGLFFSYMDHDALIFGCRCRERQSGIH